MKDSEQTALVARLRETPTDFRAGLSLEAAAAIEILMRERDAAQDAYEKDALPQMVELRDKLESALARERALRATLRRIAASPCARADCVCCNEDGEWARAALAAAPPSEQVRASTAAEPSSRRGGIGAEDDSAGGGDG